MTRADVQMEAVERMDVVEFFRRLGLRPADGKQIMKDWRRANRAWRMERARRIADHGQRVQEHLRRFGKSAGRPLNSRRHGGRPRAVWCVELGRPFSSLTAAAAFVGRSPSNISQALMRGVRCGPYHWEDCGSVKSE